MHSPSAVDEEALLAWARSLPLSRSVSSLRDFADGYLLAELLHLFYPKTVNLIDFKPHLAARNWAQLNKVILRRLRTDIMPPQIELIAQSRAGSSAVVTRVLSSVQQRVEGRPIVGQVGRAASTRESRVDHGPTPFGPGSGRAGSARAGAGSGSGRAARSASGSARTPKGAASRNAAAPPPPPPPPPHAQTYATSPGGSRRPVVRPMRTADTVLSARERERRASRERDATSLLAKAAADTDASTPDMVVGSGYRPASSFGGGRSRSGSRAPLSGRETKARLGGTPRGGGMTKAQFLKEYEREQKIKERQERMRLMSAHGQSPDGAGGGGASDEADPLRARFEELMSRRAPPLSDFDRSQERRATELGNTLAAVRQQNLAAMNETETRLAKLRETDELLPLDEASTSAVEAAPPAYDAYDANDAHLPADTHAESDAARQSSTISMGERGSDGGLAEGSAAGAMGDGREHASSFGAMTAGGITPATEDAGGSGPALGSEPVRRNSSVSELKETEERLKAELAQAKAQLEKEMADERAAEAAATDERTAAASGLVGSRLSLGKGEHHEWVKGVDPASGHPYWYNTITKVSQWHDPNPASSRAGHAAQQPSVTNDKDSDYV